MFGGDPFSNHPFMSMRRQMQDLERMMQEPFGMFNNMNQIMNSAFQPQHFHPQQNALSSQVRDPLAMDLFGGMGGFGFGGGLMQAMNHPSNDNAMVFSQSTMVVMNPDGTQRVVSNSTRKAGDVKETRHTLRDGNNERVSVGHHIGDRSHFIEKKRDKDGRFRQNHKFVNLDQDEAEDFNNEFKSRANRNISGLFGGRQESDRRAIEGSSRNHRSSNLRSSEPQQSGSSAPIISIPDDDDNERPRAKQYSSYNPYLRTGPTIVELSDEEAEIAERSKRRKGAFGKFFTGGER